MLVHGVLRRVRDLRMLHAGDAAGRRLALQHTRYINFTSAVTAVPAALPSLPSLEVMGWDAENPSHLLRLLPATGTLVVTGHQFRTDTARKLHGDFAASRLWIKTVLTSVAPVTMGSVVKRLTWFRLLSDLKTPDALWKGISCSGKSLTGLHIHPRNTVYGLRRHHICRRFWYGLLSACCDVLQELSVDLGNFAVPSWQAPGTLRLLLDGCEGLRLRSFAVVNLQLASELDLGQLMLTVTGPHLRSLRLQGCGDLPTDDAVGRFGSAEWLSLIGKVCPMLEKLAIKSIVLQGTHLDALKTSVAEMPRLRSLCLSRTQGYRVAPDPHHTPGVWRGWRGWNDIAALLRAIDKPGGITLDVSGNPHILSADISLVARTMRELTHAACVDARNSSGVTESDITHAVVNFVYPNEPSAAAGGGLLDLHLTLRPNLARHQRSHLQKIVTLLMGSHRQFCPDIARLRVHVG